MKLTHLLEPITINKTVVKNRLFRPGHGTYHGRGYINDSMVDYHEARARTGVGMSILECVNVHPSTGTNPTVFGWDDSVIPGLKRIADAAHKYDMKMLAQVWHGGHHWPGADGSPPWSASDVPSPWGHVPVPMTRDMIEEIVQAFAATALRIQEGGLDGVEMHFGHGYLCHQFFSPLTNLREDEYGGSLENRMRFGREVLRAVRKAVDPNFIVGIRISDQNAPGGVTSEECGEIAQSYADEGLLDYVNASMGSYHNTPSMLPGMDTPTGSMLPSSGPIVDAVRDRKNVVRMVVGRYRTVEEADQAIRDDTADMIGINRAMIADPDFLTKSLADEGDRVRPCIGCNQGCIGGILGPAGRMGCVVNPAVGYEGTLSEHLIVPSETPKKIVVVGGGPAGMEAARTAAMRGHKVVLFEASARLGGQLNIAKRAPKSAQIGDIAIWLEAEIYRLGVDVRLSTYAEAGEIRAEEPDAVIIATGSIPRMDGIQASMPGRPATGIDQPHVYSSHDIYDVPDEKLGKSAVIFDDVGHYEALGIAEYLTGKGLKVTFATRMSSLAPKIDAIQRLQPVEARIRNGDFALRTAARLVDVGKGEATLGWLWGDHADTIPADIVVLVTHNHPNAEVFHELGGNTREHSSFMLKIIGDAASPRDLQPAISEGHMAGRFVV